MIIVAGTMTLDPAVMLDFRVEAPKLRALVLMEKGARHYSLLIEDEAHGLVNVSEMWEDDEALEVHLKQPWVLAYLERFGPSLTASTVQVYDLSNPRPLPM